MHKNNRIYFVTAGLFAAIVFFALLTTNPGLLQGNLNELNTLGKSGGQASEEIIDLIRGDLLVLKAEIEELKRQLSVLQNRQDVSFPAITEKFVDFAQELENLNTRLIKVENRF